MRRFPTTCPRSWSARYWLRAGRAEEKGDGPRRGLAVDFGDTPRRGACAWSRLAVSRHPGTMRRAIGPRGVSLESSARPRRGPSPFSMNTPYRFYASEISYFSGKVRPALRQKGIFFVEHLPTPAAYRDVILPRTGLGFIPIVVTPEDETWQDTSEILDALERRHPEPALVPGDAGAARRRATCSNSTPTSSWCCRRCTTAGAFPRASARRAPTSPPPPATRRAPASSPTA